MIRVLFVCLGNICRSPMAQAVFSDMVKQAGLEAFIEADSAGCGNWQVGAPPHSGTRAILDQHGIEYSGVAREITPDDLLNFDYIITMDDENLRSVKNLAQQVPLESCPRIAPLLDFSAVAAQNHIREVPDPYHAGGFDVVFRLIHSGCSGLLEEIRRALPDYNFRGLNIFKPRCF